MKTVIVLGSKGMAGSMILSYFTKVGIPCLAFSRPQFDVSGDWKSQLQFIDESHVVINCIGIIPQKYKLVSTHEETYRSINEEFPHELAQVCTEKGSFLIHLSTNCVFENGPSNEVKQPDASDMYGASKARGEPRSALVIRTSIIGPEPYGPYVSLLEWFLHSSSPVRGFTNHTWNGVTTLELAKALAKLVQEPLESYILHLFSPVSVSKYQLLLDIQRIYGVSTQIHPFATECDVNTTLSSIHPALVLKTIPQQLAELHAFQFD